jgi:hypothetical protein
MPQKKGDVPFSAQAVSFGEFLEKGEIPEKYLSSDYVIQQFVERLVHYVLTVRNNSYSMAQLSKLLDQIEPGHQVYFFKKLKETSPHGLRHFAPLYYGFMAEFESLLFT